MTDHNRSRSNSAFVLWMSKFTNHRSAGLHSTFKLRSSVTDCSSMWMPSAVVSAPRDPVQSRFPFEINPDSNSAETSLVASHARPIPPWLLQIGSPAAWNGVVVIPSGSWMAPALSPLTKDSNVRSSFETSFSTREYFAVALNVSALFFHWPAT